MTGIRVIPRSWETGLVLTLLLTVYLLPGRLLGLPVSLHGILLIPLLCVALLAHSDRLFSSKLWPYWGLAVVTLLSAVAAGSYGRDVFRPLILGVLTTVGLYAVGRPAGLRILFLVLVPLLVVDGLLGAVHRLSLAGLPEAVSALRPPGRVLHRGTFLVIGLLATGAMFLRDRRTWWLVPFTILALGAVVTGLRGVWLAGAAGLVALVIFDRRPRVLGLVACATVAFWFAQHYMERKADAPPARAVQGNLDGLPSTVTTDKPPTASSAEPARRSRRHARDFRVKLGWAKFVEELTPAGRLGYWQAGLRMAGDHPLLGVGPGNYPSRSLEYRKTGIARDAEARNDPHSVYVGILAELGIAGAACLAAVLFGVIRAVWRLRDRLHRHPALMGTAAAVVALGAAGLTWDLHVQRVWWVAFALLLLASEEAEAVASA